MKIEDFKGFSIEVEFDKIAKRNAQELASKINQKAKGYKWGSYASSWEVIERKWDKQSSFIVRSKEYRLAHLLEKGHLVVNKNDGVGRTAPRPHIFPSTEQQKRIFEREISNVKIKLKEN